MAVIDLRLVLAFGATGRFRKYLEALLFDGDAAVGTEAILLVPDAPEREVDSDNIVFRMRQRLLAALLQYPDLVVSA